MAPKKARTTGGINNKNKAPVDLRKEGSVHTVRDETSGTHGHNQETEEARIERLVEARVTAALERLNVGPSNKKKTPNEEETTKQRECTYKMFKSCCFEVVFCDQMLLVFKPLSRLLKSKEVVFTRSLRLRAVWRSNTWWIEAKSVGISLDEIKVCFWRI
ncbi:hypothetical protein E3N88_18209 [Mikania micrantha]|uniref:Uncharacterized protein n=1 Tax=Mikania micrantha TaxID=192012 RepID=A0A5N6NVU1_9ASTR|nr:hypothetical protein E3N88_18209 [Mikania micrantha]